MKNDFVLLRVSNRGTNVFTADDHTYRVNLPPEIIRSGVKKLITIIEGTISIDYLSVNRAAAEIGVLSNIGMNGYDTEVEGSYKPKTLNWLFQTSQNSGHSVTDTDATEDTLSLSQGQPHSFITYDLPEQLEFTRYSVFRGVATPLAIAQDASVLVDTNYISFVLKIEYLEDCGCGGH